MINIDDDCKIIIEGKTSLARVFGKKMSWQSVTTSLKWPVYLIVSI